MNGKDERVMRRRDARKAFIYLAIGLVMLFYAVPRLPDVTFSEEGVFTIVWLLFALLTVGANLYVLIGVDKERRKRRNSIRSWEREMMRAVMRMRDDDHHKKNRMMMR
jgi:hypothetical protein